MDAVAEEKSALLAEFTEDVRRLGLSVKLSEDGGSLSISSKPVGLSWFEMRIEANGTVSSFHHDFPKGAVPANDATVAAVLAKDAQTTLGANGFNFSPWLTNGPLFTQWKNSLAQGKDSVPYGESIKALGRSDSSFIHLSHDFYSYSTLIVTPPNEDTVTITLQKPRDLGFPVFATDEFSGAAFEGSDAVNLYFDKGRTDVWIYKSELRVFFSDVGTIAMSPNDRSAYHRDPVTKFESLHMRVEPDKSGKVSVTAPDETRIAAVFDKNVTSLGKAS